LIWSLPIFDFSGILLNVYFKTFFKKSLAVKIQSFIFAPRYENNDLATVRKRGLKASQAYEDFEESSRIKFINLLIYIDEP
jgi:hypothetical protein